MATLCIQYMQCVILSYRQFGSVHVWNVALSNEM